MINIDNKLERKALIESYLNAETTVADEKALVEALNFMIDHYQDFDVESIREVGQQYTCECIGKQLFNVYENAMDKSKH